MTSHFRLLTLGVLAALGAEPVLLHAADTPPAYPKSCDTTALPTGYEWPPISSTLPYDRTSLQTSTPSPGAADDCGVFETQKQFDLYSWAAFIALNWPAKADGTPLSDTIGTKLKAPRVWETYLSPAQIFKKGGAAPDPWGTPENEGTRGLDAISKKTHHILDEVDEAFFNNETPLPPIVDLNGAYARYEIRINEAEYKYIVKNTLYSREGQETFVANGNSVSFPEGDNMTETYGAMEVKVAWKKLGTGDDASKFYTITPEVYHPYSTPKYTKGDKYGLVGMHIMVRTKDAPQWIWATFEHVDNAPMMNLIPNEQGGSHTLKVDAKKDKTYNFWSSPGGEKSFGGFDPKSYEAMVTARDANVATAKTKATAEAKMLFPDDPKAQQAYINQAVFEASADYYQEPADRLSSQITRVITTNNDISVSKWTEALNAKMHAELDKASPGNVWTNYRLISTQWPVNPEEGGAGNPAPVSLGNPVMETYMQVNGSCMGCHVGATFGPKTNGYDANFSFMLQRAQGSVTTN